jgi:hypothetical protein
MEFFKLSALASWRDKIRIGERLSRAKSAKDAKLEHE